MENVPAHLLTRRIGPSLTDDLTAGPVSYTHLTLPTNREV